MANVDSNTKLKSTAFEKFRKTGDLTGSLSPDSSAPAASVAQDEDPIGRAIASAKRHGITLDPGTLNILAAASAFQEPKIPGFSEPRGEKEKLDYWAQLQKEQALERQRLGKESTAEAFKYKMLQQGIDKISNAFNPYGSKEGALAYAAHLNNLPNVVNETMRSIPMMNVQGVAYNAPQQEYFKAPQRPYFA
jgi:hypothetical protein